MIEPASLHAAPGNAHASAGIPRSERASIENVYARWELLDATPAARAALLDDRACADLACYQRNVENYIGTVKLPVGLAGPLRVNGKFAHGDYYLPLATTEAALVASFSRGARLISECGGCRAAVLGERIERAPGYAFSNTDEVRQFTAWVLSQEERLREIAGSTTRHGRLTGVRATIEGNHVYLNLEFTTGDAAGQNIVTFAAEAVCRYIARHAPVQPRYAFLEVNHSGDKKASARALQSVRGRRVVAEARIPAALVETRLHTTAARMCDYWRMAALGGVLSGTIGVQGHYANGLAALYIACGQDPACVAEAAVGITRLELEPCGDLYAAVTLPALVVGTVGGGTSLPSQHACLEILGLAGPGKAHAFAEVCASLALAGELSLIGALCAGEFARAHAELARGASGGEIRHG